MAKAPEHVVVYASTARTADPTPTLYANYGFRGVEIVIDCTASADTPSVVFTIQGYSPLGDDYFDILASAAVTGAATTRLRVYPGFTASANTVANDSLPGAWRVKAVHADGDSITYSVNAVLLP